MFQPAVLRNLLGIGFCERRDKAKPVFVMATANDFIQLPPEMQRKVRWDELWFVNLPNSDERSAISGIVIGNYG